MNEKEHSISEKIGSTLGYLWESESFDSTMYNVEDISDNSLEHEKVKDSVKLRLNKESKPKISYDRFIKVWSSEVLPKRPHHISLGQELMNFLQKVFPEGYDKVKGNSNLDCLSNDDLVPNTFNYLREIWNDINTR